VLGSRTRTGNRERGTWNRYDRLVSRESLAFGIAGTVFGVLIGWILGSQQAGPVVAPAASASTAPAQPGPPPLDAARAIELERTANAQPANAKARVDLANLYFDAERYDQAVPWYEAALKLDPKNVDASTDLGVAYYYTSRFDQALAQLDRSLAIAPRHAKTLLNQGIIRAFGKQDMAGALESWEKAVAAGPGTEEAKRAQQMLDGLKNAHAGDAAPGTPKTAGRGGTR